MGCRRVRDFIIPGTVFSLYAMADCLLPYSTARDHIPWLVQANDLPVVVEQPRQHCEAVSLGSSLKL